MPPGARGSPERAEAGRPAELLPRDFFGRPSPDVAPALLGCVLESELDGGLVAVALTEVEAYAGEVDPASHAYRGRTARNAVMFGAPGHAYVYFTYGMHFCVNLVCLPEGTASAVLLRAGAVVAGADLARQRRAAARPGGAAGPADRDLARGPARLCQALGIDRSLDGTDVCDPGSALRIRPPGLAWPPGGTLASPPGGTLGSRPGGTLASPPGRTLGSRPGRTLATPAGSICRGPRVGVSTAAGVPWRFWIAGDPTVSVYRAYVPRRRKPSAPA